MRVLLTGGAGFVGSHLSELLLAGGHEVVVLDDLSTGSLSNVQHLLGRDGITFTSASVLDGEALRESVAGCDAVAHLAASVGVELIIREPLRSLLNNIRGTEAVLEAATRVGSRVLVTSSSEIYGKNAAGPVREDADRVLGPPTTSRWAYSTAKAVDEILAYQYWREKGLPTVVARLFNCSGPRQVGTYGMVIPRFVRQALVGEDLTVFGDGTQARCFCHVEDTVDALARLLSSEDAVGDVFNVGSQNETSIRALAELVIEMTGSSSGVRMVPYTEAYEPGFEDMERRLPDISKVEAVTGWRPSRSLRDIVGDVIRFEMEKAVDPAR